MQATSSQKRMTSFLSEFELQLRKRNGKWLQLLTQMLLKMQLQLRSPGKTTQSSGADARDVSIKKDEATVNQDCITDIEKESSSIAAAHHEGHGSGGGYDTLANLPVEFYHYYHGSNTDMGTLIEVILANPFLGVHSEAIQLVLVIHFNNTGFNSFLNICSRLSFV